MGQFNDYSNDINQEDIDDPTEDQDVDDGPHELDPESWHDWNSEHLLNMYLSMVEYCQTQGLNFMQGVTFNDFCHFIFNRSI
jgi:hypothetical protein